MPAKPKAALKHGWKEIGWTINGKECLMENFNWSEFGISMAVGAVFGAIGYFSTKYIVAAIKTTANVIPT